MPSPEIAFSLISLADIKAVSFSSSIIPRSQLHNRTLFVKTSAGNFAKLHVMSGPDLTITDLVVYNPAGCIVKTASNLTIQSTFSCDIDTATQTNTNADFKWQPLSSSNSQLEPKNGATFFLFRDHESIGFADVSAGIYRNKRIAREWLKNQIIYCKTSAGRFAKLQVEASDQLLIRNMVVYNADGSVFLSKANITVMGTGTFDVDTGNTAVAGYDLWWRVGVAADPSTYYLTPQNGATLSFESYYQYEKYLPLINDTAIRNALVISGATNRSYGLWTEIEKLQLREFIYLLETTKPLPITGPPALTSGRFMSTCDATKIYMAHVAQSFWVDANNLVTWDLLGATADHLTYLFDMRKLYNFTSGSGYSFEGSVMGNVTDWSPSISYTFLKDNGFIKANMWDTIKAVTEWIRANLIHITGFDSDSNGPFATQEDQWEWIYGYRYLPPIDKMITPLPGGQRITHGCWGTDGFLAAVLRTVNIPVKHGRSNFSGNNHSRAEFFLVARNLRHGDDPYNGWVRLGVNNVPIERVFMTDAELHNLIDAPPAMPGKTVPETATYNHAKFSINLAIEFKTNYLLHYRCADKASGISTGAGSQMWQQLHEYFTDAQIATIVADCDAAIAAIPTGCSGL